MTKTDDGGPAYSNSYTAWPGMTLRDWFAGQAMNGILCHGADWRTRNADGDLINQDQVEDLAIVSYEIADAMLKERNNIVEGR